MKDDLMMLKVDIVDAQWVEAIDGLGLLCILLERLPVGYG